MSRPQQDVPTELIIHYIVRDYQRMFNGFHAMREEKQAYIDELLKKISKKTRAISSLQAENKTLKSQIKEMRASRDAVVKEMTEDLEVRLKAANRKNNLLVQALQDPNIVSEINTHVLVDDDDREWMEKANGQLEKAMLNFVSIQARLKECEEALDVFSDSIEKTKVISKVNKAFSKIDSCVNHIEDFFRKVGNIRTDGQIG